MTKEEANKKLEVMLEGIQSDIELCEKFASKHGLSFCIPLGGDTYGIPTFYGGKSFIEEQREQIGFNTEEELNDYLEGIADNMGEDKLEDIWISSSQLC